MLVLWLDFDEIRLAGLDETTHVQVREYQADHQRHKRPVDREGQVLFDPAETNDDRQDEANGHQD